VQLLSYLPLTAFEQISSFLSTPLESGESFDGFPKVLEEEGRGWVPGEGKKNTTLETSSPSTALSSHGSEVATKTQRGSGSGAHQISTTVPHAGVARAASDAASGPAGESGRTRNGPAPARPRLQIPESHGGQVTQVSTPTSSTQVRTTSPAVGNPTPSSRTPPAATRTPRPAAPAATSATPSSSAATTSSRGPDSRDPRTASRVQPPAAVIRAPAAASPARAGAPRQWTTSAAASVIAKQQRG
jgi:hypothetical protein